MSNYNKSKNNNNQTCLKKRLGAISSGLIITFAGCAFEQEVKEDKKIEHSQDQVASEEGCADNIYDLDKLEHCIDAAQSLKGDERYQELDEINSVEYRQDQVASEEGCADNIYDLDRLEHCIDAAQSLKGDERYQELDEINSVEYRQDLPPVIEEGLEYLRLTPKTWSLLNNYSFSFHENEDDLFYTCDHYNADGVDGCFSYVLGRPGGTISIRLNRDYEHKDIHDISQTLAHEVLHAIYHDLDYRGQTQEIDQDLQEFVRRHPSVANNLLIDYFGYCCYPLSEAELYKFRSEIYAHMLSTGLIVPGQLENHYREYLGDIDLLYDSERLFGRTKVEDIRPNLRSEYQKERTETRELVAALMDSLRELKTTLDKANRINFSVFLDAMRDLNDSFRVMNKQPEIVPEYQPLLLEIVNRMKEISADEPASLNSVLENWQKDIHTYPWVDKLTK